MPDYLAQICARCGGCGYLHRYGSELVAFDGSRCPKCENCPDCGRDGLGPGVAWGALRRPWGREAAEAMLLSLLGRNWRSFCADDAEIEERIGDSIAALDAALAAQARRTEATADDGPATHDR